MRRRRTTERGYGYTWQVRRLVILERDRRRCHYCGQLADSVDHVLPKIDGGTDDPTNLVACCTPCNSRRSLEHQRARRGRPPYRARRATPYRARRADPPTPPPAGALADRFFRRAVGRLTDRKSVV